MPVNVSASYSVRVAPGKQGAIVCGVFSASHAFSMGASIVNVFSNCIPEKPPGNGGRLPRLPGAGVRVEERQPAAASTARPVSTLARCSR